MVGTVYSICEIRHIVGLVGLLRRNQIVHLCSDDVY
jgi:hypothetical protein